MTNLEYLLVALLVLNLISAFFGHGRRLQNVEHKLNLLLDHLGIAQSAAIAPSDQVIMLAKDPKQRIAAIKAYRQQTGAELREAVAIIDKVARDAIGPKSKEAP